MEPCLSRRSLFDRPSMVSQEPSSTGRVCEGRTSFCVDLREAFSSHRSEPALSMSGDERGRGDELSGAINYSLACAASAWKPKFSGNGFMF